MLETFDRYGCVLTGFANGSSLRAAPLLASHVALPRRPADVVALIIVAAGDFRAWWREREDTPARETVNGYFLKNHRPKPLSAPLPCAPNRRPPDVRPAPAGPKRWGTGCESQEETWKA